MNYATKAFQTTPTHFMISQKSNIGHLSHTLSRLSKTRMAAGWNIGNSNIDITLLGINHFTEYLPAK